MAILFLSPMLSGQNKDAVFLSPADFLEDPYGGGNFDYNDGDYIHCTLGITPEARTIYAPLHLPHGSVIDTIQLYFMDGSLGALAIRLVRRNFTVGLNDVITQTDDIMFEQSTAEIDLTNYYVYTWDKNFITYRQVKPKGRRYWVEITFPDTSIYGRVIGVKVMYWRPTW